MELPIEVTEEEINADAAEFAPEFHAAFVELWKRGAIYPTGRNAAGKLVWCATPGWKAETKAA